VYKFNESFDDFIVCRMPQRLSEYNPLINEQHPPQSASEIFADHRFAVDPRIQQNNSVDLRLQTNESADRTAAAIWPRTIHAYAVLTAV